MLKRGQVMLFFLLGIVLIVTFGIGVLYTEKDVFSESLQEDRSFATQQMQLFVESCLTQTTKEGLVLLGKQGGYSDPSNYYELNSVQVPIYLDNGFFSVPSINAIEDELDRYIEDNLAFCINGFNNVLDSSYSITDSSISSQTSIREKNVVVTLKYPLIIQQRDSTVGIDRFTSTIDFDFEKAYGIVSRFLAEQGDDTDSIHYGFLAENAYHNDYFFDIIQIDADTVIYSLRFDSVLIDSKPFVYNFAVNYDWEDLNAEE